MLETPLEAAIKTQAYVHNLSSKNGNCCHKLQNNKVTILISLNRFTNNHTF